QIPAKVQLLMEVATRKLFLRKRRFATAAQAQLWMEWRRNAVAQLISLGIGLVIACAGFVHFAALDEVGAIASAWSYIVCALLTLWACISFWTNTSGCSSLYRGCSPSDSSQKRSEE